MMLRGGPPPERAAFGLVLLHGRGAGARDILGVGEALALPDVATVAPEAPGLSWWPTSFLAPSADMEPFVVAGLERIDAAVSAFETGGVPRDRIGLLGFSQGACLAAEYLACKGAGLGFGFVLSGGLVGTADTDRPNPALHGFTDKRFDYKTRLSALAVYMSCHEADPHIPYTRFSDSADALRRLGAKVDARSKPGAGHGIDETDVARVRAMLNQAPQPFQTPM